METKNINDVEHIPISSIELDGNAEDVQERLNRAKEELHSKRAERQQVENDRKLADHINKHYGKDLKDVGAFITLCKVKNLTAEDNSKDILELFKRLPKSSKKNALSRFLKL